MGKEGGSLGGVSPSGLGPPQVKVEGLRNGLSLCSLCAVSALKIGSVDSAFVLDVTNPTAFSPRCLITADTVTLKLEAPWGRSSCKQVGPTVASDPPKLPDNFPLPATPTLPRT